MKRQEFVEAVYDAGWRATADAHHKGINALWEKLFPTAAAIELEHDDYRAMGINDCLREIEKLCTAIDHGGNAYPRPATAEYVLKVLQDKFGT